MISFLLIHLCFGYEWENLDVNIYVSGTNLLLSNYIDEEFRIVDKELPILNKKYFNIANIRKIDTNDYYEIRFGNTYFCGAFHNKNIKPCKTSKSTGKRIKLVDTGSCLKIVSEDMQCLTKKNDIEKVEDKILTINEEFYRVMFESCSKSKNQCFSIKKLDKESEKSKKIRKNESEQRKIQKINEPDAEPQQDYDLKYVQEDLDEAHHYLAEEDSDAIISTKHYVPECFYGYNSMSLFFNDPLPNLRKLKQKYCIHNRKNFVKNI